MDLLVETVGARRTLVRPRASVGSGRRSRCRVVVSEYVIVQLAHVVEVLVALVCCVSEEIFKSLFRSRFACDRLRAHDQKQFKLKTKNQVKSFNLTFQLNNIPSSSIPNNQRTTRG